MSDTREKKQREDENPLAPSASGEDAGNGLVPLYWFLGAVVVIVLLTWLGSEG